MSLTNIYPDFGTGPFGLSSDGPPYRPGPGGLDGRNAYRDKAGFIDPMANWGMITNETMVMEYRFARDRETTANNEDPNLGQMIFAERETTLRKQLEVTQDIYRLATISAVNRRSYDDSNRAFERRAFKFVGDLRGKYNFLGFIDVMKPLHADAAYNAGNESGIVNVAIGGEAKAINYFRPNKYGNTETVDRKGMTLHLLYKATPRDPSDMSTYTRIIRQRREQMINGSLDSIFDRSGSDVPFSRKSRDAMDDPLGKENDEFGDVNFTWRVVPYATCSTEFYPPFELYSNPEHGHTGDFQYIGQSHWQFEGPASDDVDANRKLSEFTFPDRPGGGYEHLDNLSHMTYFIKV